MTSKAIFGLVSIGWFTKTLSLVFVCLFFPGLSNANVKQYGNQQLLKRISERPIPFEPNTGQFDKQVKFLSRGSGHTVFLTPEEAVLTFPASVDESKVKKGPSVSQKKRKMAALRMRLLGGNSSPEMSGEQLLAGVSNYFKGKDAAQWRTGVPHYGRVRYKEVYDGIDLAYYGAGGKFEYDFIVSPGNDPSAIRIQFQGANKIDIDEVGNLVLETDYGKIVQEKPVCYQEIEGKKIPVEGKYQLLAGNEISFHINKYDNRHELVIDPVIVFSTYLGGSSDVDISQDITTDSDGNVYVTGYTQSSDFPDENGIYSDLWGDQDAFIF
ncbi:MAG: hypothetical protein D3910_25615, partial [Candidatus Electrothrix sp. ATG2]|nr:hypothetical protein [Candidatus Electrothrix sp. ATG2]